MGTALSPGSGPEAETISTLFNQFKRKEVFGRFFRLLYDSKASLAVSVPPHHIRLGVAPERLDECLVFGAATGLMLAYGKYPDPFSPLFLLFLFNEACIDALTEPLVQEWAPELQDDLRRLLNCGIDDDISFVQRLYTSYCDADVSCLLL